jgi:steroid delta-isomerase-like uncharacterized protein
MSTTQMQSPVRRLFEEAFNQGDLAVVDEIITSDHIAHNSFKGAPIGPQGLKSLIASFRTAFPDLQCTVEDEINEGNKIAAHWTMRGTQKGPFLGNPRTGRLVEAQGIIFARISNGRIAEDWTLIDQMGILQQLGIVPPPRGSV